MPIPIQHIDLTFPTPAENIAYEEVLLEQVPVEGAVLRFWESEKPFVVLGTAQKLYEEVYEERCVADGIPILRRCSAGGCVLQGLGSLNFTLALPMSKDVNTIRGSYCYILGKLCDTFAKQGIPLKMEGICDLTLEGAKVSGNAQRRKKDALLHHGTLLYHIDHTALERYLREPADRPEYRANRTHQQFVTTIPLDAVTLKKIVLEAFEVTESLPAPEEAILKRIAELAREKYSDHDWTYRR